MVYFWKTGVIVNDDEYLFTCWERVKFHAEINPRADGIGDITTGFFL